MSRGGFTSNGIILISGGGGGGSDPNWANVTALLLNNNAVNGTTTFADQSTSALSVARGGNTVYSNTSPPSGMTTWGAFDGAGDTLDVTSTAAVAFGTGDFTVEFYIQFTDFTSSPAPFDLRTIDGDDGIVIYWTTGGVPIYRIQGTDKITSGAAMSTATKYHVALSRVSGTSRLFVAGAQVGSNFADSVNMVNQPIRLGAADAADGAEDLNGFMCSVRITKGAGRYTVGFTPPTLPMPNS